MASLNWSLIKWTWNLFKAVINDKDIYVKENLSEKLLNDGFNPEMVMDFSKTFIMAHSSGAHVVVNYLKVSLYRISLAMIEQANLIF